MADPLRYTRSKPFTQTPGRRYSEATELEAVRLYSQTELPIRTILDRLDMTNGALSRILAIYQVPRRHPEWTKGKPPQMQQHKNPEPPPPISVPLSDAKSPNWRITVIEHRTYEVTATDLADIQQRYGSPNVEIVRVEKL